MIIRILVAEAVIHTLMRVRQMIQQSICRIQNQFTRDDECLVARAREPVGTTYAHSAGLENSLNTNFEMTQNASCYVNGARNKIEPLSLM